MISLIKNAINILKYNRKGSAASSIVVALIIAAAIIVAMLIFTGSQTHPVWEVR